MSIPIPLVDRLALMAALNSWCTCKRGELDALLSQCPGHKAFSEDADKFSNQMGWGRWFAPRLLFEEFNLRKAA